jgi:hypothetical protein
MADDVRARRWKVCQLTNRADVLLNTARKAQSQGDTLQWRVKILEAFLLIDLAWKVAAGNAHPDDEAATLADFDSLQAIMHERITTMQHEAHEARRRTHFPT